MLILQSLLVYGFMIWVMTYNANRVLKRRFIPQNFRQFITDSNILVPILIFSLFAAVRYRVGVDCETYKFLYYYIMQYGETDRNSGIEQGFLVLAKMTQHITSLHYLFFFILAFLQICPLYYALRKRSYELVYLGLAIILSATYLSLMNGVRQNIVACTFVAMIPLILEKKKWIRFVAMVFLCSLMHKSAFVLLPIGVLSYFILSRGTLNIKIQLLIVAVCYLLMDRLDVSFLDSIFAYGEQAGYDENAINAYSELEATNKNFGLWAFLTLFVKIIVILYCDRIKKLDDSRVFNVMYNLFFIGLCINLLFYNNFTIERLSYYFTIFTPIVISILLFVTSRSPKSIDRYVFICSVTLLTISFLYLLYKASVAFPNETILYKFDLFRNDM